MILNKYINFLSKLQKIVNLIGYNRINHFRLTTNTFLYKIKIKLELWVTSLKDTCTARLQYYDDQTLEYRYISKLPMKKTRIWSNVKETTSHLQNKITKNIHLGVATRSSTKWDCLKPIRFHQYTWGLQHFLTFVQEDIGHIKCCWFKINYLFLSSFYIANIQMWKGQLKSYFIQE
jgi:hypothetical protein